MADSDRLPVQLAVSDDLQRSRVTVCFRIFLAIPHLVFVAAWGMAAFLVSFILWLALLFEGRAPPSLQGFVASYVRYAAHVGAYVHLAASPFPRFAGASAYPVDVEITAARSQSRKSVGFRIFLVLPALVLASVLGGDGISSVFAWIARTDEGGYGGYGGGSGFAGAAAAAALLVWFAAMARGRAPQGLRDLIAYTIGYAAQVVAYALLVTDRYPTTDPAKVLLGAELPQHPVRLDLHDELHRSRLTVFFRLLLAFPHLVWLTLWTLVVLPATVVAWFAALVGGRVPQPLHRFIAAWIRYAAHVTAFLYLVGGPFPGFVGAAGSYPVDIQLDPAERQPRLVTLFRAVLVIPALVVSGALGAVLLVVAVLGWWAALCTGRMPEGLRNLGAVSVRYAGQVNAYLFLVTPRYPYACPAVRDRPRHHQLALELYPTLPAAPAPGIEGA